MSNDESEKKKSNTNILIGCAVILVLLVIIFIVIFTCLSGDSDTTDSEVDLNASVRYDDGQFIITNNDDFAWHNVEFDLNYEGLSSGYTLSYGRIDANSTYTVGSMQFTKSDGTMFNPFTQKPLKMSIHAKTPDGKDGWWFGGWK